MKKTVFLAGATGAIGKRLCKILVASGCEVIGTTRKQHNIDMLKALGVQPVVLDVFDAQALSQAVAEAKPDVVIHQLTDLPYGLDPEQMEAALVRNARLREEGTRNLVAAAVNASVKKMIAQSLAFVYEPSASDTPFTEESPLLNFNTPMYGETAKAVASLESQVLNADFEGVILRYGLLYGEGTGIPTPLEGMPPVQVDAAAHAAFLAMQDSINGIFNITEQNPQVSSAKAVTALGWSPEYRCQ